MSMQTPQSIAGYSAAVTILVHSGGQVYAASQVSDQAIFFTQPTRLTPGPATVDVTVDDTVHSYPIDILDHAAASTRLPIRLNGTR